jgi:hypothetical protein
LPATGIVPLLMGKYISAAERIAPLAVGADGLPKPTFSAESR